MIHDKWLHDTKNKQQLLAIQENSKALIGEIINLATKCYEGYEKTIQLIIDLKSAAPVAVANPATGSQP